MTFTEDRANVGGGFPDAAMSTAPDTAPARPNGLEKSERFAAFVLSRANGEADDSRDKEMASEVSSLVLRHSRARARAHRLLERDRSISGAAGCAIGDACRQMPEKVPG
jgi:hypothetical protein